MAQLHGQIAVEDYESTGYTLSDSIGIYTGWSVGAGTATVSDAESQEQPSGQSILMTAGSTISEATRTVQAGEAITTGVAWWDFWVLPVAHSETDANYSIDADFAKIEFRSTQVIFDALDLVSYGVGQDGQHGLSTTATVSDAGSTIRLEGNSWKAIPYDYTLTADTVLTFEVTVADEGEIIGIVLETNLVNSGGDLRAFQLGGTDTNWSQNAATHAYTGPGYETITIPVGQYVSGSISYLALVADDDVDGSADVTFRNVHLHEGALPAGDSGEIVIADGSSRIALPEYFAVTGSEADAWMRLTLRQDYTNGIWDLYVDGQSVPVAANLGFDGTPTEPTSITIYGDTASPVYFDLLQLASTSPIFTDADNDGMLDTWETTHGLNPALNDRGLDLDLDTLTNMEEYVGGTAPGDYYNDVLPTLTKLSGDAQFGTPGEWLAAPFVLGVESGGQALNQAPISFADQDANTTLSPDGVVSPAASLDLRTDALGEVEVYGKLPEAFGYLSVDATATAGAQSVTETFSAYAPLFAHYDAEGAKWYGDFDGTYGADEIVNGDIAGDHDYREAGYAGSSTRISQTLPIDPSKSYRLSGMFKSAGIAESRLYFGFTNYTENDDSIYVHTVRRRGNAGTITAISGTEITVSETLTGWHTSTNGAHRRLGIYLDGDTNKYPDYMINGSVVRTFPFHSFAGTAAYSTATGNTISMTWDFRPEIESQIVLGQTKVMNHGSGGLMYSGASNALVPYNWRLYERRGITGEAFDPDNGTFWFGVGRVAIILLANFGQTADHEILFDDIILEEEVDTDNDGLLDWWEREAVIDADPNDAITSLADISGTSDPDGDGLSLADEFAQGKMPLIADNVTGLYYVDNLRGSSSYNGLSADPNVPLANDGPKPTVTEAISAATTGSSILVRSGYDPYSEATINLVGKDLTFRMNGDVTLRAQ
ncbi:hypothetical protein [Rubellicoccus peritrichatus]|uniref:Uncharacterized protein n=1 Tax=Rubellicoccus peritrichatus TaxID=3080537 RepID=A0AAQ3LFW6_9BACT|nr:hypothetical protein [Puniceicoccus sp. CR14]WOO41344.1 hypothetical protein RZN69_22220 [Puniceicoccus sp. CR14]